jgi:hypothetical protein
LICSEAALFQSKLYAIKYCIIVKKNVTGSSGILLDVLDSIGEGKSVCRVRGEMVGMFLKQ